MTYPLFRLTTSVVIILGLILVNCEGVEGKGVKSEQKWRSCYVIKGVKKVRRMC